MYCIFLHTAFFLSTTGSVIALFKMQIVSTKKKKEKRKHTSLAKNNFEF